jgi:hypothetical protein
LTTNLTEKTGKIKSWFLCMSFLPRGDGSPVSKSQSCFLSPGESVHMNGLFQHELQLPGNESGEPSVQGTPWV